MQFYFILPVVCIGVPVAIWIYYSVESPKKLLSWILGVLLAVVLGYYAVSAMWAWGDRWMKESVSAAFEPFLGGSIDSVVVGGRPLSTFSNGIQVTQGKRIDLTGWIQSNLGDGAPPEILLCSTNGAVGELSFSTLMVPRPDVVLHEKNPSLMESGFSASVQIPKGQPIGEYYFKILKKDKSRLQTYLPGMSVWVIAVVSASKEPVPIKKTTREKRRIRKTKDE